MCMAIPMKVIASDDLGATCEGRSGTTRIDTLLTGPLEPGQWVLTFLGAAREVVSEEEARRVNDALDALEGVLNGHTVDIDAAFADLVNREPQLPPHLQAAAAQPAPALAAPPPATLVSLDARDERTTR